MHSKRINIMRQLFLKPRAKFYLDQHETLQNQNLTIKQTKTRKIIKKTHIYIKSQDKILVFY